MIKLVLSEVVEAIGGQVVGDAPMLSVNGVSTDSRTVRSGELFFALQGPNFDGHEYVSRAFDEGAIGAVIKNARTLETAKIIEGAEHPGVLVAVNDPLKALGKLAAFHRSQSSADVITVVGSNGKSTTKAMIDHILQGKLRGRCNPKSFNNNIGVPLTLLSAEAPDDYLVVEVGTNSPGEVAELAELARPKMTVITCISEEHLEGLGDLNGVALEECSVLAHVPAGGFAAINVDWPRIREFLPSAGPTIATFGRCAEADLRVTETRYDSPWLNFKLNDRFDYRLRMPGAHNALNAAGAIAVALRWGFEHGEIAERLESFTALPMRSEVVSFDGLTVINDAYNANPDSAVAAIEALEAMPAAGRRIVVFGEMRELGEHAPELHRRVAERLASARINHVCLVGSAAEMMSETLRGADSLFGPKVDCCETVVQCRDKLAGAVKAGDVVLLKGSRLVGLDRLVGSLRSIMNKQKTTPVD